MRDGPVLGFSQVLVPLAALLAVALGAATPSAVRAHPVGFGVLQLEEDEGGRWHVLLRVSGSRARAEAVEAVLPEGCEALGPATWEVARRGVDRSYRVQCPSPLVGEVGIVGIGPDLSMSLRLVRSDGTTELAILDASAPTVTLEDGARLGGSIFAAYAALGIEHILSGVDHLLFVLGLLLLLRGRRRALILTITSFTVGHSITLALATLGYAPIAGDAAEAIIALSILLLAVELVSSEEPPTLTRRYPGLVAGAFGLVHGLGFAGALAEIGLPQHDGLTALFAFNVGVEIGQLIFVGAAVLAIALGSRLMSKASLGRGRELAIYGMGGLAAFFVIDRLVSFAT